MVLLESSHGGQAGREKDILKGSAPSASFTDEVTRYFWYRYSSGQSHAETRTRKRETRNRRSDGVTKGWEVWRSRSRGSRCVVGEPGGTCLRGVF